MLERSPSGLFEDLLEIDRQVRQAQYWAIQVPAAGGQYGSCVHYLGEVQDNIQKATDALLVGITTERLLEKRSVQEQQARPKTETEPQHLKATSEGESIRERRLARGLSQEDLARRIGVKPSSIEAWENGTASSVSFRDALNAALAEPLAPPTEQEQSGQPAELSEASMPEASTPADTASPAQALQPIEWPYTCSDCGRGMDERGLYRLGDEHTWAPVCAFCAKKHSGVLPPAVTSAPATPPKRGRGRPKKSHEGDQAPVMRVTAEKVGPDIEEAFVDQAQAEVACPVCESDPTQASMSEQATVPTAPVVPADPASAPEPTAPTTAPDTSTATPPAADIFSEWNF